MALSKLQKLVLSDMAKELEQLQTEIFSLARKHDFSEGLCTSGTEAAKFHEKLAHTAKMLTAVLEDS